MRNKKTIREIPSGSPASALKNTNINQGRFQMLEFLNSTTESHPNEDGHNTSVNDENNDPDNERSLYSRSRPKKQKKIDTENEAITVLAERFASREPGENCAGSMAFFKYIAKEDSSLSTLNQIAFRTETLQILTNLIKKQENDNMKTSEPPQLYRESSQGSNKSTPNNFINHSNGHHQSQDEPTYTQLHPARTKSSESFSKSFSCINPPDDNSSYAFNYY